MLPKLQAFYMQGLLPELACPREGKSPGIREPGIWVSLKIYDIQNHFLNSSKEVSIYSCSKYMYFLLRAQIPLKHLFYRTKVGIWFLCATHIQFSSLHNILIS
jgi:hypothetical protein